MDESPLTHHMAPHATHPGMTTLHNMNPLNMAPMNLNGHHAGHAPHPHPHPHHLPHPADGDFGRKYSFGTKLEDSQSAACSMTLNLVKSETLTSPYMYPGLDPHAVVSG